MRKNPDKQCPICGVTHNRRGFTCSNECASISRKNSAKEKNCEYCGESFKAIHHFDRFCSREHFSECKNCGKRFSLSDVRRPSLTCSTSCAATISHTDKSKRKRKENSLEKYGVEHPFQAEEIKKKIRDNPEHQKTLIGSEEFAKKLTEIYGVTNIRNSAEMNEKFKKKFSENHDGIENPFQLEEVKEKIRKTNQKLYGRDSYSQTDEFKEKVKETSLEKYGVEHPLSAPEVRSKIRESNLEKYGVEHPQQSLNIREKTRQTNLKRYGVEHVFQNEDIKNKIGDTNLEKYGARNPFASPEIQEKIRETLLETYGVTNPSQMKSHKDKVRQTSLERYGFSSFVASPEVQSKMKETMLKNWGAEHALQVPELKEKAASTFETNVNNNSIQVAGRISKLNRNFKEFLKDRFDVEAIFEKTVDGCSYDLYVSEKNMLIELNPVISHNSTVAYRCVVESCDLPCTKHEPVKPSYHFDRAVIAQKNGMYLTQIYDWDDSEALFSGKLSKKRRSISAHNTVAMEISAKDANDFLSLHHVQGGVRGQSYCFGLFLDDELVAVATFGKPRFRNDHEFEFVRFSVNKEYSVHGAASKLFNYFVSKVHPKSVISYIDFNHSTLDTFLSHLDFVELTPTGPQKIWWNPKKRSKIYASSVLKLGADRLLGTSYGSPKESGLNNDDIMLKEGYLEIFTAGNRIFSWISS